MAIYDIRQDPAMQRYSELLLANPALAERIDARANEWSSSTSESRVYNRAARDVVIPEGGGPESAYREESRATALRTAIEEFAGKVNFPIGRIDVMDGSRRSAHSNAYFSGFGKSRRIALFDTLLDKHTTEEIVSVVAHEVGHYKKKHVITGTVLGILETGLMLYIFNYFMSDQALFDVFGVKEVSVYCGLVLFGMLYSPVSLITSILTTAMSRKNEFEADAYAL